MRSAIFHGAGQPLVIEDRDVPRPGKDQAVIRVERCGICGSDIHMTSGSAFDVPAGTALGHEYAGEVVDIGPTDVALMIGDRVTAVPISGCGQCPACLAGSPLHCAQMASMQGGYSDYVLIDTRSAIRLPDGLGFDDGALVEPLASALRGVSRINIEKGARVAVIGAGAIGSAAAFWARRYGAGPIAVIARSNRNEELAGKMGADAFLTLGEELGGRLNQALGGPPDIVIEGAGAVGAINQSIDLVRPGGTVLSLGGCIHGETIMPAIAMFKDIRLQFSVAYGIGEFHRTIETLDAGHVEPRHMIGETIGLGELPAKFEAMRSGSHAAKVMVAPHRH